MMDDDDGAYCSHDDRHHPTDLDRHDATRTPTQAHLMIMQYCYPTEPFASLEVDMQIAHGAVRRAAVSHRPATHRASCMPSITHDTRHDTATPPRRRTSRRVPCRVTMASPRSPSTVASWSLLSW